MKVAIYIPSDLNINGGVEKHILRLSEAMRLLGLQVDVFGKIPPLPSRSSPEQESTETFYALSEFDFERYDVIHTHSGFYNPGSMALQLQRKSKHRFVHTLHTVSLDYLFSCKTWWNWRCYWSTLIEGMWSRYADHVIAVSENARRLAELYFGISQSKCTVIWNGVTPLGDIEFNRREFLSKFQLGEENIVVMFVGRGEDRVKGTALIADSMDELYETHPQIRLLAVPGSGFEDAPWLRRTGPIAHKNIGHCYLAADMFINASLSEGFPLTIIEALAAGVPVIASPVGGIPEIVSHNANGLLLRADRSDLTRQIERLLADTQFRKALGKNGQYSVADLTWENLAKQTIGVYESLFKEGRR